jgi:hypothetical protein
MVGPQLPMLVKLVDDRTEDLAHGFAMEDVRVFHLMCWLLTLLDQLRSISCH